MVSRWGRSVLSEDGQINRRKVASIVFGNGSELEWLNSLLHPLVREEIRRLSEEGTLFCAIPLFFEIGWNCDADTRVVSSWCDEKTQLERLKARGWSQEEIARRLASQISRDEKLKRADYGIITSCSWECMREQCRRVFNALNG